MSIVVNSFAAWDAGLHRTLADVAVAIDAIELNANRVLDEIDASGVAGARRDQLVGRVEAYRDQVACAMGARALG